MLMMLIHVAIFFHEKFFLWLMLKYTYILAEPTWDRFSVSVTVLQLNLFLKNISYLYKNPSYCKSWGNTQQRDLKIED